MRMCACAGGGLSEGEAVLAVLAWRPGSPYCLVVGRVPHGAGAARFTKLSGPHSLDFTGKPGIGRVHGAAPRPGIQHLLGRQGVPIMNAAA